MALSSRAFVVEFEIVKGRRKGRLPREGTSALSHRPPVEKIVDYFPQISEKIETFPLVNSYSLLIENLNPYLSNRS
jgi:hypothetical protein